MPSFSDGYGVTLGVATTLELTVLPFLLGQGMGIAITVAAPLDLTVKGGTFGPGEGRASATATALDLSMHHALGSGRGAARGVGAFVWHDAVAPSGAIVTLDFTNGNAEVQATLTLDGADYNIATGYGEGGPYLTPPPQDPQEGDLWTIVDDQVSMWTATRHRIGPLPESTAECTDPGIVLTLVQGTYGSAAGETGWVVACPLLVGPAIAAAAGRGDLSSPDKHLTLSDVARQIYALWSIEVTDLSAITIGRKRIADWTNATLQQIYSRSDRLDYFNRKTLTVTVGAGGEAALSASVQRLQGPVRAQSNKKPLRSLNSRAEFESFAACYDVGTDPTAFFLDAQSGAGVDSVELKLCIAPPPSEDTAFLLDVTLEPPRFDTLDIVRGVIIPIPHKWAESLLLPLVKKWALADGLCTRRAELEKEITQQFLRALEMLGLADPSPGQVSRPQPKEVTAPS